MKSHICLICEKRHEELEEAEVCERSHAVTPAMRARGVACVFCDHDPCTCAHPEPPAPPAPPMVLAPEALLRLGALTLEQEKSEAIEQLLDDQALAYQIALEQHGPQGLITALRDRDRLLLHQGRQIADGRSAGRLLREFMRAALYTAGGTPQIEAAEAAIRRLGGEPADARQLKLHGSTLGPLEAPETVAGELASGARKTR